VVAAAPEPELVEEVGEQQNQFYVHQLCSSFVRPFHPTAVGTRTVFLWIKITTNVKRNKYLEEVSKKASQFYSRA
jgi:hypothetical protein